MIAPTDPAAYSWPTPTAESIRAQLAAEREQRQSDRLAELLRGAR